MKSNSHPYHPLEGSAPRRRPARSLVVGVLLLISLVSLSCYWMPAMRLSSDDLHESTTYQSDEYYSSCSAVGGEDGWTNHLGGMPGFEVFEHVWYHGGVFHMYNEVESALPFAEEILSPRTAFKIETEKPKTRVPDVCFRGTTAFFNEGVGKASSGISSYYGFIVENVLGAYAALSNAAKGHYRKRPVDVDNAIVARDENWSHTTLNVHLAKALWGKNVVGAAQWKRLENAKKDQWVYFDKVVIVDREAAKAEVSAAKTWNSMPLEMFTAPHYMGFWAGARHRVREYIGVPSPVRRRQHHIVYVDRQDTNRRLSDRDHAAVLHSMSLLAEKKGVRFTHIAGGEMAELDELRAVAEGSILIGVHGEKLGHMAWMQDDASVIELLPSDVLTREYEGPARALGFHHTAIHGNKSISKSFWSFHSDLGPQNVQRLFDGTAIPIHLPLLVDTVRDALNRSL